MSIDEALQSIPHALSQFEQQLKVMQSEIQSLKHGDRISYNLKEAAELTGIDPGALRLKCKQGKIAYSQEVEGGTIIIKRKDLEQYLDEHNTEALTAAQKQAKKGITRALWNNGRKQN